jgi:hypothetical protein
VSPVHVDPKVGPPLELDDAALELDPDAPPAPELVVEVVLEVPLPLDDAVALDVEPLEVVAEAATFPPVELVDVEPVEPLDVEDVERDPTDWPPVLPELAALPPVALPEDVVAFVPLPAPLLVAPPVSDDPPEPQAATMTTTEDTSKERWTVRMAHPYLARSPAGTRAVWRFEAALSGLGP